MPRTTRISDSDAAQTGTLRTAGRRRRPQMPGAPLVAFRPKGTDQPCPAGELRKSGTGLATIRHTEAALSESARLVRRAEPQAQANR
jgi:hypothetical protein